MNPLSRKISNSLKQWYIISCSGSWRRFTHSVNTQVILCYPNVLWWIYNLQYLESYSKFCVEIFSIGAPAGVLGIWGEWLYIFIFRELGSTGNYFSGAREQANNFGDIGSLAKKQKKNKQKPPFCLIFKKFLLYCIYFGTNMLIKIDLRENYGN